MKTRKLILIIADVLLLAVCILQGVLSAKDGAKYFSYKENPDELMIETPSETIHLVLENEKWVMNTQKYPVPESSVTNLLDSLNSIRALDKVAAVNENNLIKYELADGKKITVEARVNGKTLRKITVGKEAASGSQSYITVDDGKDIYLVAGSLKTIYNKSINDLRTRLVWGVEKEDVNSASITNLEGKTWSVSKMGSGDDVAWNISGEGTEGIELDGQKLSQWFDSLAIMSANAWCNDSTTPDSLNGTLVVKGKIGYGFNTITLSIYQIYDDSETPKYYGLSSESPYMFEMADYQVQKYIKTPEDFVK